MKKKILGVTLFDLAEVAKKLGVTRRTVQNYVRAGVVGKGRIRLTARQFAGRWWVAETDLKDFLEGKPQRDTTLRTRVRKRLPEPTTDTEPNKDEPEAEPVKVDPKPTEKRKGKERRKKTEKKRPENERRGGTDRREATSRRGVIYEKWPYGKLIRVSRTVDGEEIDNDE